MSIQNEILLFFADKDKVEQIDAIVAILTFSTISVTGIVKVIKTLPRTVAILTILIVIPILSLAVYNDYGEVIGFFFPDVGYFATDPACQSVVTAAETELNSCSAYVYALNDEITNGPEADFAQYRASSASQCIDDSNNFSQLEQNNANNIPLTAQYALDSLVDAERYYGQILTDPNERRIPELLDNKFSFPKARFDLSIQYLLNSCRQKLFF